MFLSEYRINLTEEVLLTFVDLLEEHHSSISSCFNHPKQELYSITYLKGLLSSINKKTVEAIALRFLGKEHVRYLQKFLKESPWDHEKALSILQEKLYYELYSPNSMITIDSSEIVKKGKESVGVGRQYCGCVGKVENSQSGVFVGITGQKVILFLIIGYICPKNGLDLTIHFG